MGCAAPVLLGHLVCSPGNRTRRPGPRGKLWIRDPGGNRNYPRSPLLLQRDAKCKHFFFPWKSTGSTVQEFRDSRKTVRSVVVCNFERNWQITSTHLCISVRTRLNMNPQLRKSSVPFNKKCSKAVLARSTHM